MASKGIAEVADGTPDGAGSAAVATLRERVWGRMVSAVDGADVREAGTGSQGGAAYPAALAFAAYALGFLTLGGESTLATNGRWTRLTTQAGHALTRR